MVQGCNPENIGGAILKEMSENGAPLSFKDLEGLPPGNINSAVRQMTEADAQVMRNRPVSPDSIDDEIVRDYWAAPSEGGKNKGVADTIKDTWDSIMLSRKRPESVLGEDVVDQFSDYYEQFFGRRAPSRGTFDQGVREIIESVEQLNPELRNPSTFKGQIWKQYSQSARNDAYNTFFKREESGNPLAKVTHNITQGVVDLNANIFMGNAFEFVQKALPLYGSKAIDGIRLASEKGLFKKHPELEQLGLYGLETAGQKNSFMDSFMELTDVPLKNLSYYTGLASGGEREALRAVDRVAFRPRAGNLTPVEMTYGGRASMRLLNYAVNSTRYVGDLMVNSVKPGPVGDKARVALLGYLAITYGLGGPRALPFAAGDTLRNMIQNAVGENEVTEFDGALSELAQAASGDDELQVHLLDANPITKLGLTQDMLNKRITTIGSFITFLKEHAEEGDMPDGEEFIEKAVPAALAAVPFISSNRWANNSVVQRAIKDSVKASMGDEDWTQVPGAAFDRVVGKGGTKTIIENAMETVGAQ